MKYKFILCLFLWFFSSKILVANPLKVLVMCYIKPNVMDQKIKTLQEIKNSNLHTIKNIKNYNGYSAGMYWDRELQNQPDNNIAIFKNDTLMFVIKG